MRGCDDWRPRRRHRADETSLSELRSIGFESATPYWLALIADALGRIGQFDETLRTIDESFPIIERRSYEAEVHRLKGELLLTQSSPNAAQAEQSFRTAIEIARGQNSKSWELRATTSLARLLRAKALLEELGG